MYSKSFRVAPFFSRVSVLHISFHGVMSVLVVLEQVAALAASEEHTRFIDILNEPLLVLRLVPGRVLGRPIVVAIGVRISTGG